MGKERTTIVKTTDDAVGDIIEGWLKANGYDGLYSDDGECACRLAMEGLGWECDRAYPASCRPGYLAPGDGRNDFYISAYRTEEEG